MWQPLLPVPGVTFTDDEQGRVLLTRTDLGASPGARNTVCAPGSGCQPTSLLRSNRAKGREWHTHQDLGQREMPVRPGRGTSYISKPFELEKASRSRLGAGPRPWHRERLGAGSARWASPADPAEGKWRPPLCTARVRPADQRRCAPTAGSEGAGRALTSAPRRGLRPRLPGGCRPPSLPTGRRSVPAGSPPPPRPLRS